jgi:hypothetical protein
MSNLVISRPWRHVLLSVLGLVLCLTVATAPAQAAPERSMWIELQNLTFSGSTLTRVAFGLSGGCWSNGESAVPPEQIAPGGTAGWGSESCGFATGTAGYVAYRVTKSDGSVVGDVTIRWSNPYVGRNKVEADVPNGVLFFASDTSGNNASVRATLMSF